MRFFVPSARVLTIAGTLAVWAIAAATPAEARPVAPGVPSAASLLRAEQPGTRQAARPLAALRLTLGHDECEPDTEPADDAETEAVQSTSPAPSLAPSPPPAPVLEALGAPDAASPQPPDDRLFTPRAPRGPPSR